MRAFRWVVVASVIALAAATSVSGAHQRFDRTLAGATGAPIAFSWAARDWGKSTAAGDLYVVHADGRGLRRLRSWPDRLVDGRVYGVGDIAWAPDGKKLALTVGTWRGDPFFDVALINADGSGLRKITQSNYAGGVRWSPNGRLLAYTDFQAFNFLRVIRLDGRQVRLWRFSGRNFGRGDWSPDGRTIAAADERGVFLFSLGSGDRTRLTRGADSGPQWSRDGKTIAFIRCLVAPCYDPGDLFLADVRSKQLRRLTRRASISSFEWSPNGSAILYTETQTNDERDEVSNNVGVASPRGATRLLTTDDRSQAEAWSPDGRKILFTRNSDEGAAELWSMNSDGSQPAPLPFNRADWSVLGVNWRR